MPDPEENDDKEINELSDIYSILRLDAKAIINDLKGGIVMWREAAGGAAASTGFIIILILTMFHYSPPGQSLESWAYVIGAGLVAVVMTIISVTGFRRYFQLRKKYASLFERARKL